MCGRLHQQRRGAGAGGQRQPAGDGEIVFGEPPHFADHHGERAAFQRVLHRLEQRRGVGSAHEHEAGEIEPVSDEAGTERDALLAMREILDRQQSRGAARGHEAGGQTQREAERGRRIRRRGGSDLMQRIAREAAAEPAVELARQREPARAGTLALDGPDSAPQMGNPFGPVVGRHPFHRLMFTICSKVRVESERVKG